MIAIPSRGVNLAEISRKEIIYKIGVNFMRGIIYPTFYRNDQNRVWNRLIKATEIPPPIENKDMFLFDDVFKKGVLLKL